ncbi:MULTISPECIES: MFS transporter [Streptomyces]|uniref:ABC transporter integral membrane protein n=1 Tax=Streptomyces sviceus (strain ATCC 29083 / DSM 924 / JCM 4929 / NBRC 13980 / NCIMB 11184 / NRRL 5439 / UC 5370) TaxID=463191 RepID=B5HKW3_STRX2|nr:MULTISPECIES: MFS transporter [Streptomyces]EDY53468.1 ABC transporter integral membrane protein [Streptomyces sviceus ATCC 29083]MYT06443.1 MFS transporter [Streptomyces sp. SID5470]
MASTVTSSRPGYGQLLRTRGAWTFLLPGFAARQPFAMLTLSLVLLVQHTTGSYGAAGAVAAVTGVSMAVFAPYSGRLADRYGQRAVLIPGVLAHTLAGLSLTALALTHAPLWALFVAAVPTGASVPQIGPMVRARWGVKLQDSPLITTAAAFESVTDELTFVFGPLLATALCTAVHPAAGLLTEASLTLLGGLLFAAQKSTQPTVAAAEGHARVEHTSALRVPGVRVLIVTFLGIGSVFGGMQVSLAAFSASIGEPGLNGVLYGVFAAGNMLSGLVCGAIAWKVAPQRRLLVGYGALALTASGLWAAHSVLVLAGLGLLVGMCIAPTLITGYTLVENLVPAGARTEAFTWLTGAVALGQAAAVTIAGQLEDRFWGGAGFLVPMGGTLLALVTLVALRSRLATRPRGRTVARGVGHRVPVAVD